jgi:hypothetical protein
MTLKKINTVDAILLALLAAAACAALLQALHKAK